VTKQEPCMGPLTRTGCGALCPHFGKACFACYGPSETVNSHSLVKRYQGFGVSKEDMIRRFNHIQNNAAAYKESVINIARNFDE
ncbi:MAG: sulfhydrogenase subunit delta, partial [Gammaproteobacteria bacterium]|nr:sulfhydrogenase subunit delta [Gammaproteobacteria bacterium]